MNHLTEGWQNSERSQPDDPGEVNLLGESCDCQLIFSPHPRIICLVKPILSVSSGVSYVERTMQQGVTHFIESHENSWLKALYHFSIVVKYHLVPLWSKQSLLNYDWRAKTRIALHVGRMKGERGKTWLTGTKPTIW